MYKESGRVDNDVTQKLFDLLIELVLHTPTAIGHFRKDDEIANAVQVMVTLKPKQICEKTGPHFLDLDHIQKLVDAQNTLQLNRQLSSHQSLAQLAITRPMADMSMEDTNARVSSAQDVGTCNTLPFPVNPFFHGREEILENICKDLTFDTAALGISSVAIWGTGGIGKTQIALQFANKQLQNGMHAVIWISSETEAEVSKCFNEAAAQLKLPEYKSTNTPGQNRLLVLQWLQSTTHSWLLVFDNVEVDSVLKENWPVVGNGNILVTCRSENLAANRAAKTIEIPTFSIDESSDLMLKIIDRKDVSDDEIAASKVLSSKLGGLALAVDLISKQVRSRRKSICDFVPYYEMNYGALHKTPSKGIGNPYYEKDLTTVWKAAFENLSDSAVICMRLLCFTAPESVPSWLLSQNVELGDKYAFLKNEAEFEDAKLELLDFSLIRVNEKNGRISMHRLIQTAFFDQIGHEDSIEVVKAMYILLRNAFPDRSVNGHLYTRWELCGQLSQHVLAWKDRYKPLYKSGFAEMNGDATTLIMDAARYIEELGSFITCEEIINPLLQEYPDKESLVYSIVCIEAGTLYDRTGRSVLAFTVYQKTYDIEHPKFLDEDPYGNNIANTYSRMNLAATGMWRGEDGLVWIEKAIECMTRQNASDEQLAKSYTADRFWRNRGRTNYLLGRYEDAEYDFLQAEKYQALKHGKNSHYDGESGYMFAKIYYKQQKWEKALEYAQKAYDLMAPGKPNHATIIATRYLQAIILNARSVFTGVHERDDQEALRYLNDALAMCRINEAQRGNQGESARVNWRMSQVLARRGLRSEAKIFLDAAEETKQSLQATGEYPIPEDEEESWNALVGLLYR